MGRSSIFASLGWKLPLNDEVVAVNDEDVSGMTASEASALLTGGSGEAARGITVLRGSNSRHGHGGILTSTARSARRVKIVAPTRT